MEEKKSIKMSLSTVLLIFALIIIVAMAYYIYIEKTNADKEISTLQSNSVEMQNTINDLQEKIDTISNTINSNTNADINNSETNNTSKNENVTFSDKQIKECITNYLNIFVASGGPDVLLSKLGLLKDAEIDSETDEDYYKKTNIKYSEFKVAAMNYMTEEWFGKVKNTTGTKEQDGLLYIADAASGSMKYEVDSITLKGDYSDLRYIANTYSSNSDVSKNAEKIEIEFEITNYNGKCVISYCDEN